MSGSQYQSGPNLSMSASFRSVVPWSMAGDADVPGTDGAVGAADEVSWTDPPGGALHPAKETTNTATRRRRQITCPSTPADLAGFRPRWEDDRKPPAPRPAVSF